MNDTLIKPISQRLLRKSLRMAFNRENNSDAISHKTSSPFIIDQIVLDELNATLGIEKADGLVRQFLKEADLEIEWLTSTKNAKRSNKNFLKRVHKLAGSASLFGAIQLHDVLFQIETICKSGTDEELKMLLQKLAEKWKETKANLI